MNVLTWKQNGWSAKKDKTPPPPPPGNDASTGQWVAVNFSVPKSGPAFATQWIWMPTPDHVLTTVNGPNGATAPTMSLRAPVVIDSFPPPGLGLLTAQTRWGGNPAKGWSVARSAAIYPPGQPIDPPVAALVLGPTALTGPSSTPGAPSINDVLNAAGASNLIGSQWYSGYAARSSAGFPAEESIITLRSLPGQPVEVSTSVTQPPSGAVTAAGASASPVALVPAGPNWLLIGFGFIVVAGLDLLAYEEL
jgi:hypothetical protein